MSNIPKTEILMMASIVWIVSYYLLHKCAQPLFYAGISTYIVSNLFSGKGDALFSFDPISKLNTKDFSIVKDQVVLYIKQVFTFICKMSGIAN